MYHTKEWFIDRIGKKIYRDKTSCGCPSCRDIDDNWLIIFDKNHATYLYDVMCDYWYEWIELNYRDEK